MKMTVSLLSLDLLKDFFWSPVIFGSLTRDLNLDLYFGKMALGDQCIYA